MSTKMDRELMTALQQNAGQEKPIDVIVTVTSPMDVAPLKATGMNVKLQFESISAVAGNILPSDLQRLESLENVIAIELDSSMHAI